MPKLAIKISSISKDWEDAFIKKLKGYSKALEQTYTSETGKKVKKDTTYTTDYLDWKKSYIKRTARLGMVLQALRRGW